MSAAFKLSKQKPSQQDLRRLMQEQKQQRSNGDAGTNIDSPFAKYIDGQLNCQLCKSVVRSAAVWKVHVNGKQHKENLNIAKSLKEKIDNQPKPLTPEERLANLKRSAETLRSETDVPEKRIKGILKNSGTPQIVSSVSKSIKVVENSESTSSTIPQDFFDSKSATETKKEEDSSAVEEGGEDDALPEGFFDDPVKDAKIRNQEYKDPNEAEWEKFQKEIKEAEIESSNIINEDYEDEIVERQIEEIDVQMRNWSKVISLEKKKELIEQRKLRLLRDKTTTIEKMNVDDDDDVENDEEDDDNEVPDFVDWRAKKIKK